MRRLIKWKLRRSWAGEDHSRILVGHPKILTGKAVGPRKQKFAQIRRMKRHTNVVQIDKCMLVQTAREHEEDIAKRMFNFLSTCIYTHIPEAENQLGCRLAY